MTSDVPLRLTRAGCEGLDGLEIRQGAAVDPEPAGVPLRVWRPRPHHPFSARLHRLGRRLGYYADGVAAFRIDPDAGRIEVAAGRPESPWEARLWGIPAVLCFLARGDVSLHAAAVDVGGRALLLPAPSRHGKTTLAAAFHRAGHRVLGEDLCRCRIHPFPAVYPGAAVLRVREDAAAAMGPLSTARPSRGDQDRLHVELDDPARGDGAPVPLGGVVLLSVTDGPPRLERLDARAAIPALWPLSFHLPTDAGRAACFAGLAELAATVPVWRLSRRLRFDELAHSVDLLSRCVDGAR